MIELSTLLLCVQARNSAPKIQYVHCVFCELAKFVLVYHCNIETFGLLTELIDISEFFLLYCMPGQTHLSAAQQAGCNPLMQPTNSRSKQF